MIKTKDIFCKQEKDSKIIGINIVIKDVDDIFRDFDYISLKEKIVNSELEQYVFGSIKNYPVKKKIKLVIHIPEDKEDADIDIIKEAIHTHFMYKLKESELFLKEQIRQWEINMLIGTLFLVLCMILVELFNKFSNVNIFKVVKESFLIIGWVALWEPVTFVLFELRAMYRNRLYYQKLSTIPVVKVNYDPNEYRKNKRHYR